MIERVGVRRDASGENCDVDVTLVSLGIDRTAGSRR